MGPYLEQLVLDTWLLAQDEKWPDRTVSVNAAELDVEAFADRVLTEVAGVKMSDHQRLLHLSETWAGEDGDSELLESDGSWLGLVVVAMTAVLTQVLHEGDNSLESNFEQSIALPDEDVLDGEPRELVDRVDDAFIWANQAATGVATLQDE